MKKVKNRFYKQTKIILPTMLIMAVFVTAFLATTAKAQSASEYPPIVQKIAERFNLNVTDVEKVFDEDRDARRADMYAKFAERLNDLVSEGKITHDQKEAILDKHEEMQNKMEAARTLSPEERKQKMLEYHQEFRDWAQTEGLDLGIMHPFGKGFGNGMRQGNKSGYVMYSN